MSLCCCPQHVGYRRIPGQAQGLLGGKQAVEPVSCVWTGGGELWLPLGLLLVRVSVGLSSETIWLELSYSPSAGRKEAVLFVSSEPVWLTLRDAGVPVSSQGLQWRQQSSLALQPCPLQCASLLSIPSLLLWKLPWKWLVTE